MYSPEDKILISFDELIGYTYNFDGFNEYAYGWAAEFFDLRSDRVIYEENFPYRDRDTMEEGEKYENEIYHDILEERNKSG